MSRVPIFLSAPKSFMESQEAFLKQVEEHLCSRGLQPQTLGRSDYDMDAPLVAIRRLMAGSCGLITLAFRRTFIRVGTDRPGSDLGEKETSRTNTWLTSPYCQIEPAMAYQLGLPILIWREDEVLDEGLLDRGALGIDMPSFDLTKPVDLTIAPWANKLEDWIGRVRSVHRKRGEPIELWR